jgi:hypothetical protein
MTNKEVYDIVEKGFKAVNDKLDHVIECKEDKKDANRKNGLIYRIIFSLFGVNVVVVIGIIITIWKAM